MQPSHVNLDKTLKKQRWEEHFSYDDTLPKILIERLNGIKIQLETALGISAVWKPTGKR